MACWFAIWVAMSLFFRAATWDFKAVFEVGDVSLVVLAVVQLHDLGQDRWLERLVDCG